MPKKIEVILETSDLSIYSFLRGYLSVKGSIKDYKTNKIFHKNKYGWLIKFKKNDDYYNMSVREIYDDLNYNLEVIKVKPDFKKREYYLDINVKTNLK